MLSLLILALLFVVGLFSWACGVVVRNAILPAKKLAVVVERLPGSDDPDTCLAGNAPLLGRARAICRRLATHEELEDQFAVYDLDRDLRSLRADLGHCWTVARAAAGILIIVGLLITLFNLRGAVGEVQRTFGVELEKTIPANAPQSDVNERTNFTDTIRQGMQGIAGAAATAFRWSSIVISFAALLLFVVFLGNQYTAPKIQRFELWAEDTYHASVKGRVSKRPEDTVANLSATIEHLVNLTKTFETTNAALQDLKLFGEKIDKAAGDISQAVANLPNNIGASMANISADVARGINQDLRHQAEYLKGILAIYSDQQSTLKKIVEFTELVGQTEKSSSDSLSALKSLPNEIRRVADSVKTASEAVSSLRMTAQQLDDKVTALPMKEMNAAASELRANLANLNNLEKMLGAFRTELETSVKSIGAESTSSVRSALADALQQIDKAKMEIAGASKESVSRFNGVSSQILESLNSFNREATKLRGENLGVRLNEIQSAIEQISLNPLRTMFRWGRRRVAGAGGNSPSED